jgi:branched-chain amino acid transport system ATP-binding protein
MLLEVDGLTKSFGGVHAVAGCSFTIAEKEVVGLIGPNGAGKSTVIELVAGAVPSDSGSVKLDGEDLTRRPGFIRARRGLIRTFQLARVWGRLSVMENMLVAGSDARREALWRQFVPGKRGVQEEAADRLRARGILEEFDLLSLRNAPAQALSGGQKRLLEFARILMAKPRIVLLDEPSASLSPAMTKRVSESIRRLADAGISVVLVEHDTGLVEETCPRVLCMAAGKIIGEGSMNALRGIDEVLEAYLGVARKTTRLESAR